MSLEIKAAIALVAFVAFGVGIWYVYDSGVEKGEANIQTKWDKAKADAEAKNKEFREEGYALAAEYEDQLNLLEKRYARADAQLRTALNTQVTCPASGRVGDVYLPASLVDSMFNREAASGNSPGPAASQPDATVR